MHNNSFSLKAWLCAAILVFSCFTLKAQSVLKDPLAYVAGDSVVVWGEGYNDLRGVALAVAPTLTEQRLSPLQGKAKSAFKAWLRQLKTNFRLGDASTLSRTSPMLAASEIADQASRLFLHTASGQCFDLVEHLLYNDLLRETLSHEQESFEKHTAAQALVNSAGRIYATDTAGVWVNLYINSTTHVKTAHFNCVIDQMTNMPFNGKVKIRLTGFPHNSYKFCLRLRLPYWARRNDLFTPRYAFSTPAPQLPAVYVNGRPPLELRVEGDYLVIDRSWNRGDEVMLTFPMSPRLLFDKKKSGKTASPVAILRGPLLYVVPDDSLSDDTRPVTSTFEESADENGLPILKGHVAAGISSPTAATTFTAIPYFLVTGRLWQVVAKSQ